METQDYLQLSAVNSSLPVTGQQQSNLLTTTSDSLQLASTNWNNSGSFSNSIDAGFAEAAIEVFEYSQQFNEQVLGLLGGITEVAMELVEYNQSLVEDVLGQSDSLTGSDTPVNSEAVLDLAVTSAQEQLESFATDKEFLDKMNLAFGEDWQPQEARALIQNLANGEEMPNIQVLPATELDANGAIGAFGEDTIYLSEKFLSENADDPEAVAGVLLEEIGHYVDQELSSGDSRGDEGDVFARLVQGEAITGAELAAIKAENDRVTLSLGEKESVELATPPYPGYLFEYVEGEPVGNGEVDADVETWQQAMVDQGYDLAVDGLYGPESQQIATQFQQEKGLVVDGIVGPETWEATFTETPPTPTPQPPQPEEPTSFREKVVAIAQEEYEFFDEGTKIETEDDASDRIGEYWQSVGENYTGKDDDVPWSAAFISWVMQEAGAGNKFEYSASHSNYITDAIQDREENDGEAAFFGYRLDEYSPQVGDLVSYARQEGVGYDTPAPYASHSDIVVATRPGEIDVIGGNVSDSVTLKTLDVDSEGKLIETSEDWFAVLRNQL